jgi:hypothetical protein
VSHRKLSATTDLADIDVEAGSWIEVGPQGGSNDGAKYQAPDGTLWYVKTPNDAEEARNEVLAAQLYRLAEINVPEVVLGKRKGLTSVASKWIEDLHEDRAGLITGTVTGVSEGFVVDSWLANWDVIGTFYNNLLVKDGKAFRLDTGGALRYRAQRGLKVWGDEVSELDTLRDPKFEPAYSVFRHVTSEQIVLGIDRVLAIESQAILDLVEQFGPTDPNLRAALFIRLQTRRASLEARREFECDAIAFKLS